MSAPGAEREPPADGAPRNLIGALRGDPEHAPERLVLLAVGALGEPAKAFAERERKAHPDISPAELGDRVRARAVRIASIDGAVAGSPLLIVLVPAYAAMLWEQARMAIRIAALQGRDPSDPAFPAELVWLRGIRPDLESARAAIAVAQKPPQGRRTLGTWVDLARRFLAVAGMAGEPSDETSPTPRWRTALAVAGFLVFCVITIAFPLTFMLALAFTGATSTNALARSAISYYGNDQTGGNAVMTQSGLRARPLLRGAVITLSVAVPLTFLALAAVVEPAGITWFYVLAAFLGLSLVLALGAWTARRGVDI